MNNKKNINKGDVELEKNKEEDEFDIVIDENKSKDNLKTKRTYGTKLVDSGGCFGISGPV